MNVLIVGCGKILKKHIDAIRAAGGSDPSGGIRIEAVCDRQEERARSTAAELKVPFFTSLEKALQESKAQIAAILTPSGLHAELGIQAAKAKKHVVVEKPIALKLRDADRLIQVCEENKVGLFVVKQNRYNPAVQATWKALKAGRFGKIVLATVRLRWCRRQAYYDTDAWRGTWSMDGGVLVNQASHHIDLLQWLVGPVESVFARGATQLVKIETEDTAVAVLRFENGALGLIEATTATRPRDLEGSISILGEKGSAIIGGFAANALFHWAFEPALPDDPEILKTHQEVKADADSGFGGHRAFYKDMIESLKKNRNPLVDGYEGRKSLELVHAIYESIETGREVRLKAGHSRCRLDG